MNAFSGWTSRITRSYLTILYRDLMNDSRSSVYETVIPLPTATSPTSARNIFIAPTLIFITNLDENIIVALLQTPAIEILCRLMHCKRNFATYDVWLTSFNLLCSFITRSQLTIILLYPEYQFLLLASLQYVHPSNHSCPSFLQRSSIPWLYEESKMLLWFAIQNE